MAPTALEKAQNDRESQNLLLQVYKDEMGRNATRPLTQTEVEHYIANIIVLRTEYLETHRKIINCGPEDVVPYQTACSEMMLQLSQLQCAFTDLRVTPTATDPVHTPNSNSKVSDIRLPRLQLPSFNGDLNEWMPFRDLFKAAVHSNVSLSNAQKLTYLKTSLSGDAAKLIKSMQSTDANYDLAWKSLQDRYENERELVFSVLKKFINQPNHTGESASALRSLVDVSKECIRSLDTLKVPTEHWDTILVFLMMQKLDGLTRQEWELSLSNTAVPNLQEFLDYLELRARALASGATRKTPSSSKHPGSSPTTFKHSYAHHANQANCKICTENHFISRCPSFLSMTIPQRKEAVKKYSLCFNCLQSNHVLAQCTSKWTCKTCKEKHHTLLHVPRQSSQPTPSNPPSTAMHSRNNHANKQGMLATAVIKILDKFNRPQFCRAFLDGGSTSSFISEACYNRLGLRASRYAAEVNGLGCSSVGRVKGSLWISLFPHFHQDAEESFNVQLLILPTVTANLPTQHYDPTQYHHLSGLQLADPSYQVPSKIDILLGSDVFYDILLGEKRVGNEGQPFGIQSKLGWLVAGRANSSSQIYVHHASVDLDSRLQQFWELESIPAARAQTIEERKCEKHFLETFARDDAGRYTVSLPFKKPTTDLGASRDIAIRRFRSVERRLESQPNLKHQYVKFMNEYALLGHMEPLPPTELQIPSCYIPHHFVTKNSSSTTKFRVVFDASCKTSSGVSLNDTLMVGPTIQDSLISILMRFRTHVIAFSADIAKMYRQVRIAQDDCNWQRIVWRDKPTDPIQDFRLTTVTYGTASAPFHATRVLQQLALDEEDSMPLASKILLRDFYVDDGMSGANSIKEAIDIQRQLLEVTNRGGFCLRKWTSNSPEVLAALPPEFRETQLPLSMDKEGTIKTLGLHWNPGLDSFTFRAELNPIQPGVKITKRAFLSEMSQVFDPLGWLSPTIIQAKILFQTLWKTHTTWDDPLPDATLHEWINYRNQLKQIENIQIHRCIIPIYSTQLSLHGFADASERAYAAAVYVRAVQPSGIPIISLISGKTRVAPSKQISLPRLELCAAVLLANLMKTVQESLKIQFEYIRAWSDSTVVLAWLNEDSSRWKTFVANRVTEVQDLLSECHWSHVNGSENPADCASRGIEPSKLIEHPLWWHGPDWLRQESFNPSHYTFHANCLSEDEDATVNSERKRTILVSAAITTDWAILNKFSTLAKLRRTTAYLVRFCYNSRQLDPSIRRTGPLSCTELESALMLWVKIVQASEFKSEMQNLKAGEPIHSKSRLQCLTPFIDSNGLLRVGGRLRQSNLTLNQKNPIILPRHHHLTELIIVHEHQRNFHGGPQLVLAEIQRKFWIPGAKDAIRHRLRKCIQCTKLKATTMQQIMGDLPAARITSTRPFLVCGVDYAGPFTVRAIPSRSKISFKAYLAIFVCFSTRAVHLEVVSSLTTEAFLASLKRFIARRGICKEIHSDCGTNFVGASRELKELYSLINSTRHNSTVASQMSNSGIQWKFNPPGAPHFGGLWEAGVKSVKHHLYRVIGTARLTFEELSTIMIQIEACLNSRPLTPTSCDPTDLDALTPGHFIIGEPLMAIPEPDLANIQVNRLSRWQLIQRMSQQFWSRWSKEYLTRLQQRPKWLKHRSELKLGDMVTIKDDNLPPLRWKLGRVIAVHPGPDNHVRVATIKTSDGEVKRPIVKLCLLPIDSSVSDCESTKEST